MVFPTVSELSGRLFQIITDDFDRTFRGFLDGSDVTKTDKYLLAQTEVDHPIGNLLVVRDPGDSAPVAAAVGPLCSDEFPSGVVCLGPAGQEVQELLTSRGFQLAENLPAMAANLTDVHLPDRIDGYTIQQVGAEAHELWVDTMAEGYELPRAFVERIGPAVVASIAADDEEYRYYIGFHNERAVATATIIIRDGIVGVYNISTIPDQRGQGVGGFVTGEPLRLAAAEGYRTAILQASQMGEPVYLRLGFKSYGEMPFFVRIPGS